MRNILSSAHETAHIPKNDYLKLRIHQRLSVY